MAYEELKQRQSMMWGSGPYQRVTDTHERLGVWWLAVACGTRESPSARWRFS